MKYVSHHNRIAPNIMLQHDNVSNITVATYNTYALPWQSNINTRLEQILYAMNYCDVICLQEVYFASFLRNNFLTLAKYYGYFYIDIPQSISLMSVKFFDSGLMILSKYPIVHSEFTEYNNYMYSDRYANKGVQKICIKINRDTPLLTIYNTHLQATYKIKDIASTKVRIAQLQQLNSLIDYEEPFLLLGDFNCDALNKDINIYDELLQILQFTEKNDVTFMYHKKHLPTTYISYNVNGDEIKTDSNPIHIHDATTVGQKIDYIFSHMFTQIGDIHIVNNPSISDHMGISATFAI